MDVMRCSSHKHMYGTGEAGTRVGINVLIGCKCCKCCPHNRASGACTSDGERHGMYMGVVETNNFHSHFAFILFVFLTFF